jgi:hypothetical protein
VSTSLDELIAEHLERIADEFYNSARHHETGLFSAGDCRDWDAANYHEYSAQAARSVECVLRARAAELRGKQ